MLNSILQRLIKNRACPHAMLKKGAIRMIRQAMLEKGTVLKGEVVYEVEVVEFENDCFSCLDTEEVLYLGLDEETAHRIFTESATYVRDLNESRGGLQEDGEFFGRRLTRYVMSPTGEYEPMDGQDDYGDYADEV